MNVRARIESLLRAHSGVGEDFAFTDDTDLVKDLQLDSLDRIEIGLLLEDEFHVVVSDDDLDRPEMARLAGLVEFVEGRLALT